MFLHRKELIQPVNVGTPDARFGTYLLEQFGGATGELTAALQYWVQSFHVENAGIRDMLQDIAIEEFSHLEMVGKLIAAHQQTRPDLHTRRSLIQDQGRRSALPGQSGKLLDSRLHSGGRQCCPGSAGEYLGRSRGASDVRVTYQSVRRRGHKKDPASPPDAGDHARQYVHESP